MNFATGSKFASRANKIWIPGGSRYVKVMLHGSTCNNKRVNLSCYVTRVNFSRNIVQNELGNMHVTRDDFSRNPTRNILRIQATRVQAMQTKMGRRQNFVNLLLLVDGVDCDEEERKVKRERVITAISSILSASFNVTLLSGASKISISSSPQSTADAILFVYKPNPLGLPWAH